MCGLRPCREPSGIGSGGFGRAAAVGVGLGTVVPGTVVPASALLFSLTLLVGTSSPVGVVSASTGLAPTSQVLSLVVGSASLVMTTEVSSTAVSSTAGSPAVVSRTPGAASGVGLV